MGEGGEVAKEPLIAQGQPPEPPLSQAKERSWRLCKWPGRMSS